MSSPEQAEFSFSPDGWLRDHPGVLRWDSPHADDRPAGTAITLLVLHAISLPRGTFGGTAVRDLFLGTLDCSSHPTFQALVGLRVSAHFFIDRTGAVHQFVGLHQRAWHAGVSSFQGQSGCNDFSVGVELEGVDDGPFTPQQEHQCVRLTRALARTLPALRWMAGHSDIAPGRKTDPGSGWDWPRFQARLDQSLADHPAEQLPQYFF